jgi:hypothetical protein
MIAIPGGHVTENDMFVFVASSCSCVSACNIFFAKMHVTESGQYITESCTAATDMGERDFSIFFC